MRSPCGHILTDRAAAWCAFGPGARLADIGCGDGGTVQYLNERYGFDVCGLDKKNAPKQGSRGPRPLAGCGAEPRGPIFYYETDAAALPFGDGELDGVLFQCSLSVMEEPALVLREAWRVLRPGGWLVANDFYARAAEKNFLGASRVLGRVERLETIASRLRGAGFALSLFEDHTRTMRREWAQALLDGGGGELAAETAAHREALQEARCGYGLFIAGKERKSQ